MRLEEKILNKPDESWIQSILPSTSSVGHAVRNLNEFGIKIVMIVNDSGRLMGTISDGDIRRGLLKGFDLNSPITSILSVNPLVVRPDMDRNMVLQLMQVNRIQQIPVVDDKHQVVGLHLWNELSTPPARSNLMVIMAGGKGTRLHPHTENCPKPLLQVAGKPMLEHIIDRAKLEGFNNFVISIHYLGHKIESHFGNGAKMGIKIDYLREPTPLGTAGALSLLNPNPNIPFVVTNGDVITDIKYGDLLDFQKRHEAVATMAIKLHEWQHPFGVVQTKGIEIIGFEEKPVSRTYINAGVYVLNPVALQTLIIDQPCDMPILFERLQEQGLRTVAYPMHEPWLDVGRPDDLRIANLKINLK